MKIKQINIFALAALGEGLSGGDRIFIELARRWGKKYPINIYAWEEGYRMCRRQKLKGSRIKGQEQRLVGGGRQVLSVLSILYQTLSLGVILDLRFVIWRELLKELGWG